MSYDEYYDWYIRNFLKPSYWKAEKAPISWSDCAIIK